MGAAVFVTFEREIPDVDGWEMNGKALSTNLESLGAAAKRLGLTPLAEFISMSAGDYEGLFGDLEDMPEPPNEAWFSPADGLATLHALLDHVRANPGEFERVEDLLSDMEDAERYLFVAGENGLKFHLSVDL
jgi:hypothetical protein